MDIIDDFNVREGDKFGLVAGLNYSDLIIGEFPEGDSLEGTGIGRVENGNVIPIAFVEKVSSDIVSSPTNFIENYSLDSFGLA